MKQRNPYWVAVRWLGGAALIALAVALIWPSVIASLPEESQGLVLVQAITFFAAFVAILLMYILLIVVLMIRFTNRVPYRIYAPLDAIITAGIILGIICLFQPFIFVAYRFGFLLVLTATLLFIVWSHVIPRAEKHDHGLPRVPVIATVVAAALAVIVYGGLFAYFSDMNRPVEPYGIRARLWNSYDDAQRAEIAVQKQNEYDGQIVPFLLVFNLWPAALVFFTVRGVLDGYSLRGVRPQTGQPGPHEPTVKPAVRAT
jgi:MFS family permease